jgi:hypothetical protein
MCAPLWWVWQVSSSTPPETRTSMCQWTGSQYELHGRILGRSDFEQGGISMRCDVPVLVEHTPGLAKKAVPLVKARFGREHYSRDGRSTSDRTTGTPPLGCRGSRAGRPIHQTDAYFGGNGYCLHEPLRCYDGRTRMIMERIGATGASIAVEALAGTAMAHADLHAGNLLQIGHSLSAVVDLDFATIGIGLTRSSSGFLSPVG